MARTSVSRKSQRTFSVFEFVPFLVRRVLGWRIGPRGVLLSRTSPNGVLTVVHRLRDGCSGEIVERRIAQLRPETDSYQLYWKKLVSLDPHGHDLIRIYEAAIIHESLSGPVNACSPEPVRFQEFLEYITKYRKAVIIPFPVSLFRLVAKELADELTNSQEDSSSETAKN